MIVRTWFRKERAALWQNAAAHALPMREIDALAAAIVRMNSRQPYEEHEIQMRDSAGHLSAPVLLMLPEALVRAWDEQDCEAALQAVLLACWPIADRAKYDPAFDTATERIFRDIWK